VTYLQRILEAHRERARNDPRRHGDPRALITTELPPTRGFARGLAAGESLAVIAEIKRRSPSKGDLAPNLDPSHVAKQYELGGARALSVLTDGPHFGGSADDLRRARSATSVPVLRKDFTVSALDVVDTRIMGADAILLIVAALSDDELHHFHALAEEIGLDCLVEVHDEAEVDRAIQAGARIIGVNQRDLRTFSVDEGRAQALARCIPSEIIAVAESGIAGRHDAERCAESGYRAALIGEYLVTNADPVSAVRELSVRLPRVTP
jgi:indole-3-glycerol phosphate synthase